uniref:Integrase, catalytic region, zinc finger, CCHC-type, peptidase aspartic, catalytic n=1 Tax=Tanacetum cinerariifolium TaxID=118510 RepID=A0A6L2KJM0_TANCI|nr:hypothetical protein [Tanacetum cinerariifolium]
MSRMQLNSKFVNNMLPEWGRFVTAVKLNRGLKESNYDQLYAYLKQHEAPANENKMMLDRFTQHMVDPLALMSNVSHQQHYLQSSSTPPSIYVPPHLADNAHLDLGLSLTNNLIENLTNTLALLTQSYKTFLPQTNNQLRTSSNTRNQATVQDGRVVVQNVQGRQNRGQGTNPRGGGVAGYGGVQNRVGNANPGQARQDLALNVDNVFQDDKCDVFDSDVDEAPTAHTMFMTNLSSAHPVYDEAGPSYDSDILSEYVKDNAMPGVHSNVSSIPNDAYMMIYNDMYEPHAQSVSKTSQNIVVKNLLTAELATYQEQVKLYERRARFELTKREQNINEQLRIVITDCNFEEETMKKELHSVKLQLVSTINHNKLMVEEVTSLKKDFKQKENKPLEDFLDMKSLKEKAEDRLFKQDQSLQTVHMLCRPKPYYNELNKVAIGYKNPLCLTRPKQVQPALYNEELTPEQIFWSQDLIKMKTEALKEQTTTSRQINALTVYPPNTSVMLVPRVLPMKIQVKIHIFTLIQLFSEFDKTCKKRITPTGLTEGERGFEQTKECYLKEVILFFKTLKEHFEGIQKALTKEIKEPKDGFEELEAEVAQNVVDRKHDEIERQNLLIANDNLISECLSKEVFYVATNFELNVARITEMHVANTIVELKYQNLKESFGNNPPTPAKDTPDFDSVFVIGKMQASLQGKDNVIKQLKKKISHLQETRSEADRTLNFKALDSQITQLIEKVIVLQVMALITENVNLKAQILNNMNSVSKDHVKPTVLTPGKYAIDVKPLLSRLRNNRETHIDYLRHLKESVETICEIVKEAKVKTNVPVPPSTRVNRCTDASRSQPKSNTKKNRISPAKGVNKMQVEEQPRTNKSHLRTTNRVVSSSRSKSTVINSNSDSIC